MAGIIVTCLERALVGHRMAHKSADALHTLNLAESGVEHLIWAARIYGIPGGIDTDTPSNITVSGNTLTDSNKNWRTATYPNCWAGQSLGFKDMDDTFTIASNTSDTITCEQAGADDLATVLSNAGINAYDGYAIVFIGTLVDGTYVSYYNSETQEISSDGYLNY